MLEIGGIQHASRVIVAPMAGVTDRPFRDLCREFGAFWLVGEMLTSDQGLWKSRKSQSRQVSLDETGPRWVQIAGSDPEMMAAAAKANEIAGADILDINMGCPAKKVCNKAAGSALLRDEGLVAAILKAVCAAVTIPVTLKIRLGWSPQEQNAETIAQIAEAAGIQALTVHGRTRACRFQGEVDYAAIARVKAKVSIPVIGNGDITNAQQASSVLQNTGVDAIMLGRAVQGRPWLPADIDRFLTTGLPPVERSFETQCRALARHVRALHHHYGPEQGLRIARKHVGWFLQANTLDSEPFRQAFNLIQCDAQQLVFLDRLWDLDAVGAAA
ncbi:tRNA dihydrouridine synthase DusB [Pseudomonadales bacterium]|jgi:tRNA-dihydrouridine synthase B|nr:tRNA dihydrouridine synthase DusB [Gammaproteobacteria bacterium]MDA8864161.1 tRNA dihydrouridine synthase DusB [Pseudomonadales bacterium]MDC1313733.1 tRNA dihydrouridine synthase DusB [Pseudomonadales bacterium]